MQTTIDRILGGICLGLMIAPFFALLFYAIWITRRQLQSNLRTMLPRWAAENGYSLLYQEREPFWSIPIMISSQQVVYRIVVEDQSGRKRRGWAVCGHWLMGVWWGGVTIKWDGSDGNAPTSLRSNVTRSNPCDDPLWDRWTDDNSFGHKN